MIMSSSAKADDPVIRAARVYRTVAGYWMPRFRGAWRLGGSRRLKRRREFLCARQIAVAVHPAVGDIEQFRHGVVADRDRIALVTTALEKIRGRDLLAHRLRHRHHVEPGAVAGQIHHLQFGSAAGAGITPGAW